MSDAISLQLYKSNENEQISVLIIILLNYNLQQSYSTLKALKQRY